MAVSSGQDIGSYAAFQRAEKSHRERDTPYCFCPRYIVVLSILLCFFLLFIISRLLNNFKGTSYLEKYTILYDPDLNPDPKDRDLCTVLSQSTVKILGS